MKLQRSLQVGLTIFYGQLLSIGLYDHILNGVPALIENSSSYFNIARVALGVFIIFTSILSLIVIWNKRFKLIFASGVFLLIIFLTYVVVTTIHVTQIYDQLSTLDKVHTFLEMLFKVLLLVIAMIMTFFMAKRGSYSPVPRSENSKA